MPTSERAEKLAREIIEQYDIHGHVQDSLTYLIADALEDVKREERERCAKVCDDYAAEAVYTATKCKLASDKHFYHAHAAAGFTIGSTVLGKVAPVEPESGRE